ncbi:hypothetical protein [Actinomadura sp. 6K520]|uniref:hypothetical protein n=1 Tax=Actinomadura sp. 6K520 TaxID=2530364 RepID=UPI0014044A29|nr:hypothetical protein [Actinomadura sp. 6K520]
MPSSLLDTLTRHYDDLPEADEPGDVTDVLEVLEVLEVPALAMVLDTVPDRRYRRGRR